MHQLRPHRLIFVAPQLMMLSIEIHLAKDCACIILASDVVDRLEKAIVTLEIV